jgi:AAA domain
MQHIPTTRSQGNLVENSNATVPQHPPSRPPLSAEALKAMTFPPVKYVVPGVIVEGLTLFAGKPKLGKGWLLLHAALAVARGGTTLGDLSCAEGDVLYCALEDNARRLQDRMTKLLGISHTWPRRLQFLFEMPRLSEGGVDKIRTWILAVRHPRLVIIDTLAMVRGPKKRDETQYDSDYAAVLELRKLASEHGVAIVVVHHLRKMEANDAFDTISGTLGLSGAPDSVLVMKYDRGGSGTVILHGRGRDLPDIEQVLAFNKDTCVWTIMGDAPDVRSSAERKKVLAAMHEIGTSASVRDIAATAQLKETNVRRMLTRMAGNGAVQRCERGKYGLPKNEGSAAGEKPECAQ